MLPYPIIGILTDRPHICPGALLRTFGQWQLRYVWPVGRVASLSYVWPEVLVLVLIVWPEVIRFCDPPGFP